MTIFLLIDMNPLAQSVERNQFNIIIAPDNIVFVPISTFSMNVFSLQLAITFNRKKLQQKRAKTNKQNFVCEQIRFLVHNPYPK